MKESDKTIDEQERKIMKELVRNPRISDNQIGKHTHVPVKTVNRKRKNLESKGVLNYMTLIDYGETGTGRFKSQYMYIIKLRFGITALQVSHKFSEIMGNKAMTKHTLFSGMGEQDGHVIMTIILESGKQSDMIEIFNAEIVPTLSNFFGTNVVHSVQAIPLSRQVKLFHNYIPGFNMENGIIKKDWSDENLFI